MGLEEQTIEQVGDRCQECGAKLTEAEQQAVLESGGPVLCAVHADEVLALPEEEPDAGA